MGTDVGATTVPSLSKGTFDFISIHSKSGRFIRLDDIFFPCSTLCIFSLYFLPLLPPPSPSLFFSVAAAKPTLNQLHCLRINDVIIGVVQTVAPQWEAVACCLGLPTSSVSIIQRDYKMDAVRGCEKMLREWLDGGEGVRRPLTWATLAEALEETEEFQVLSEDILTNINNLEQ
jgi:hypothetical protein